MKKILPIAFALLCFIPDARAAGQHKHRSTGHHRKQSATATAICQDGTTSYSAHRRGLALIMAASKLGRAMAFRSSLSVKM
jgi:hypothetical protein